MNTKIVILAPFGMRPKATLSSRVIPLLAPLVKRGYAIHVLAPADLWPQDAGTTIDTAGIVIEHAPLATRSGTLGMLQTSWWMLQRTRELAPDLVHLFKPKGYGALAILALEWLEPTLPKLLDSDDWEGRGGWNDRLVYPYLIKLLIDWLEQYLPARMDGMTVASRTLQAQASLFGAKPFQLYYIPNGVNVPGRALPSRSVARSNLGLNDGPIILLYTRFWEFDVQDIVACAVGVAAQRPDVQFLVLGAGEQGEEELLVMYAKRAGVRHMFDMRGWVEEATIANGLAASDLAIYPMNNTLINRAKCSAKLTEQMQAGLPIIAARVGQVAEYIQHQQSGLLVQPGNAGSIAQGILYLLDNPEEAQTYGNAARVRIESVFAWTQLAITLEHAYASQLNKGSTHGRIITN